MVFWCLSTPTCKKVSNTTVNWKVYGYFYFYVKVTSHDCSRLIIKNLFRLLHCTFVGLVLEFKSRSLSSLSVHLQSKFKLFKSFYMVKVWFFPVRKLTTFVTRLEKTRLPELRQRIVVDVRTGVREMD